MSCDLWREWLDTYVDGGCSAEESEGIEDHLRTCPACAAEALARLRLKRATRAAAARYAPSPDFRLRVQSGIQKGRRPIWTIPLVQRVFAGAVAFVLIVIVSATLWTRHTAREQALAELLDVHIATTASANPVDVVSTDRHTVKPWFQGKLPFTFNLPELGSSSFKLVGGKLVYFRHSPGAQLLFDIRKHQVSVFVLEEQAGATPPGMGTVAIRQKGFNVETWSEVGLRYVVMGDTTPVDIHDLSELLRTAAKQ
jgi:anti-sigma factor RsiW